MITKSIRLTEEEAERFKHYVAATGDVEANVLKRAALRGLHQMRLEQGTLAYLNGKTAGQAARFAGIGTVELLEHLMDKGVNLLDGPSTLAEELEGLAKALEKAQPADAAGELKQASG